MTAAIRTFESGATRNLDVSKLDFEGFLSPLVLERFAQYMHGNRQQADGSFRDSDNWQKGIPPAAYMKSGFRHFFDWWKEHRGIATDEGLEFAICGLIFNAQGYLHEHLKAKARLERELTGPDESAPEIAHRDGHTADGGGLVLAEQQFETAVSGPALNHAGGDIAE